MPTFARISENAAPTKDHRALIDRADLGSYDLLSVHFGNLEIEQLAPALWTGRPHPPAVCHVHTLEPTLFRDHLPDPRWQHAVRRGLATYDGYIYFGQYARARQAGLVPDDVPSGVAWLPTTIPPGTRPSPGPALAAALVRASTAAVFPYRPHPAPRAAAPSPTTSPTASPSWPPIQRTWPNSPATPAASCPPPPPWRDRRPPRLHRPDRPQPPPGNRPAQPPLRSQPEPEILRRDAGAEPARQSEGGIKPSDRAVPGQDRGA
ncbi:MAG: hypothetical protein ACRDNF_07680, partial [Streptosporangiaceae bacterium]